MSESDRGEKERSGSAFFRSLVAKEVIAGYLVTMIYVALFTDVSAM